MKKYAKFLYIIPFIIFCFAFTYFYLSHQVQLFVCDKSEYNLFYYDFGELLSNCNFSGFFSDLSWQVKYVNRNPFLVIFLLPFYFIFKASRFGFIFASEIMFMLPVMILLTKIVKDNLIKSREFWLWLGIITAVFFSPAFWVCSLNGIPDVCGMIPVLIAWIVYLKTDLKSRFNLKAVLLISFLLYFSFLLRRWYSVAIFSFIFAVFFDSFIECILQKAKIKQILGALKYTIINLVCVFVLVLIFGLLIQTEYVKHIISSESTERAIYSFGLDLISQLRIVFIDKLGILYFFFMFTGIISFLKNRLVRFVLLNLILYLFAFFIIMNSQFLWINHYLFSASCILILSIAGFGKLYDLIKNENIKKIFVSVLILFNIFNFFTYFCISRPAALEWLLPRESELYYVNPDYGKISELYTYLENEYNKDNNIKVALYGLNDNIGWYQFRILSNNSPFVKNNIYTETILDSDYRFKELEADYAIVLSPPLRNYADESMARMLYRTYSLFMNNEGIAKNYTLIKEYKLQDETSVFLFKREIPLTIEQMRDYASYFYSFYPEWEKMFEQFLKEQN